jgi:hypothetical protein
LHRINKASDRESDVFPESIFIVVPRLPGLPAEMKPWPSEMTTLTRASRHIVVVRQPQVRICLESIWAIRRITRGNQEQEICGRLVPSGWQFEPRNFNENSSIGAARYLRIRRVLP